MDGYPNISSAIGYSPETEKIYQISMITVTVLAVPVHLFLIFMAVFMTPKEMTVYRLTVTNTSSWSLAITIYVGVFMQPVFLFPLTVAKVGGPVSSLGQFFGGQLQFYSLMVIVINFLCASLICFTALCLFLTQSRILPYIRKWHGIAAAIVLHFGGTILMIVVFTGDTVICQGILRGAIPSCNATMPFTGDLHVKEETLALYPDLQPVISNSAIFGYVGSHVPTFLPPFIAIFLIVAIFGVSVSLLYVFKETLTKVKRRSRAETIRFRYTVAFMLTSRTLIPVSTAFVPVMALMVIVYYQIGNLFALNCALVVVALSSGAMNCLTTILVFKPYRNVLIDLLIRVRLWRRKEDISKDRISTVVTENRLSLRSDISRRNL